MAAEPGAGMMVRKAGVWIPPAPASSKMPAEAPVAASYRKTFPLLPEAT